MRSREVVVEAQRRELPQLRRRGHEVVLVHVEVVIGLDGPRGCGGLPHVAQQLGDGGIQRAGLAVGRRNLEQVDRPGAPVGCQIGKNAGACRLVEEVPRAAARLGQPEFFIVGEVEQLVLEDGTAHAEARRLQPDVVDEIVPRLRPGQVALVEPVRRIEPPEPPAFLGPRDHIVFGRARLVAPGVVGRRGEPVRA